MKNTDRIATKIKTKCVMTVGAVDCQFTNIQDAIDSQTDSSQITEIFINPGTYLGNLIIPSSMDYIYIYGTIADDCVILGDGTAQVVQVNNKDFKLENITITGGATHSGLVAAGTDNLVINDCTFARNHIGLELSNTINSHLETCTFVGNSTYGVKLESDTYTSGHHNRFHNCSAVQNGTGFYIAQDYGIQLSQCNALMNSINGYYLYNTTNSVVRNCASIQNNVGILLENSTIATVFDCVLQSNNYGVKFVNSQHNLMFNMEMHYSNILDLSIDSTSADNSIIHNFYSNLKLVDLSQSTIYNNNHINTIYGSGLHDTDLVTAKYIKDTTGYTWAGTTTDNQWTELANIDLDRHTLLDGQTAAFNLQLVGSEDHSPDVASYWQIRGLIQNAQNTITILGSTPGGEVSPNIVDCYTGGSCPWKLKVEADNVNKSLKISAKGETDETIQWGGSIIVNSVVNTFGGH
jgi:hypothetical protein